MIFRETELAGAFIIEPEKIEDDRGFFARSWCRREFGEHGLETGLEQCNISFNKMKGTLRGMHYQIAPHEEVKLVRCTRGSIFDVIIDLRPSSSTYGRHFGLVLSEDERNMLYIPGGFAHGFQTLVDSTEVFYQMTESYHPESARGVRWDDAGFDIEWPPAAPRLISERDRTWPDFTGHSGR
ncbi:MAG: dTDP-4-dehydrorhamnose 3,5-epimerase [Gammaproteobacteria bacterium]|nr:dTDP-4-dehydrorhamnose 3,5-epimerase [Gammaproteobacteria bacterium]